MDQITVCVKITLCYIGTSTFVPPASGCSNRSLPTAITAPTGRRLDNGQMVHVHTLKLRVGTFNYRSTSTISSFAKLKSAFKDVSKMLSISQRQEEWVSYTL